MKFSVSAAESAKDNEDSLLKQLQYKYVADIGKELINPAEFMEYYRKEGMLKEYTAISLKLKEFQTLYTNFITHAKRNKPAQPIIETLSLYCEKHPLSDLSDTIKTIE